MFASDVICTGEFYFMFKFSHEFASRERKRELRGTQEMDSRGALRAVHHMGREFASILGFQGRRETH